MQANPQFMKLDKKFWANVRTIGQEIGYSRNRQVIVYEQSHLLKAMTKAGLGTLHLSVNKAPTLAIP